MQHLRRTDNIKRQDEALVSPNLATEKNLRKHPAKEWNFRSLKRGHDVLAGFTEFTTDEDNEAIPRLLMNSDCRFANQIGINEMSRNEHFACLGLSEMMSIFRRLTFCANQAIRLGIQLDARKTITKQQATGRSGSDELFARSFYERFETFHQDAELVRGDLLRGVAEGDFRFGMDFDDDAVGADRGGGA